MANGITQNLNALEVLGITESEYLPPTYILGRDSLLQLSKVERNLFTDMEERESGNYIISGLTKKVTELDFTAFSFAVGQILYNQSYKSGNTKLNSGIHRTKLKGISRKVGEELYSGDIYTTITELCRYAYGVDKPDTRQMKVMRALIDTIHSTPVEITFPNGTIVKSTLCAKMNEIESNGAIYYDLHLNPIFCSRVKGYAELPQDIIKKLTDSTKKKTLGHYKLLRLLAHQNKNLPFTRTKAELLQELSLVETYKKDKSRTEKQLYSIFDSMQTIGIVVKYSIEYSTTRGRKSFDKVTFYLNKNFIRDISKEA